MYKRSNRAMMFVKNFQ